MEFTNGHIYRNTLVLFLALCLSLGVAKAHDDSYRHATREGHYKCKVIKPLKIEASGDHIDLGTFIIGEERDLPTPQVLSFYISGQHNAGISCTIEINEKEDHGAHIDATFGTPPSSLDCSGNARLDVTVTHWRVDGDAQTGERVFAQKISVEYTSYQYFIVLCYY